jgi:hypothetical protein
MTPLVENLVAAFDACPELPELLDPLAASLLPPTAAAIGVQRPFHCCPTDAE